MEIVGAKVQRAIARGVSVYQGDIDQGLADYPDNAFDYVILSQTLQEVRKPLKVLKEMLRVSIERLSHSLISATGVFGHPIYGPGRAPRTKLFPHDWYDSPNIHFLTFMTSKRSPEMNIGPWSMPSISVSIRK